MINGNTTTSSSNYINIQNSSDESQDIQNSQESNWTAHYDSPAEGYVYPRIHQYRNPQDNAMSITEHNLESSEDEVTDDESIVSSISSQVHEDDIPHFQDMILNPPSSSQCYYRHQTMLPPGYLQVQHSSNMHQAKPVTLLTANAATSRHRKKCHADPVESILGGASSILNWLCDTGATSHMTPRLDDLQDVEQTESFTVQVADGNVVPVTATGSCGLKLENQHGEAFYVTLKNVFYVPGLTQRLFCSKIFQNRQFSHHPRWIHPLIIFRQQGYMSPYLWSQAFLYSSP